MGSVGQSSWLVEWWGASSSSSFLGPPDHLVTCLDACRNIVSHGTTSDCAEIRCRAIWQGGVNVSWNWMSLWGSTKGHLPVQLLSLHCQCDFLLLCLCLSISMCWLPFLPKKHKQFDKDLPRSSIWYTPETAELALRFAILSSPGPELMPWTAESTLVKGVAVSADMIAVIEKLQLHWIGWSERSGCGWGIGACGTKKIEVSWWEMCV